ncbi:uncharacterized protein [Hetaerina americana]|uniref:uncharacterized protein n=1 Tax=Hetaerina americana TaxID=62018 RepID=UPI003A7F5327
MSGGGAPDAPSPPGSGGGGGRKAPITTILIYPTVAPETVVIPIVSCILGFPLLALLVICCLRRRAQLARERERRRAAGSCEFSDHGALSLVRLSPVHRPGQFILLSAQRASSMLAGETYVLMPCPY